MDVEWFLEQAGELLAIPSTADRPAELARALGFVLDFVGPGFTVERFESGGKPSALVYQGEPGQGGSGGGRGGRGGTEPGAGPAGRPDFRVILNAHLDVVPAPPDQFLARREGGRLYARGAQDMKISGLAEALAFRELAGTVAYPLALQLVTDEEVGGRDGTGHQIERGVRGDFVLIGETSGLRIVTESKGMLGVTLRASGRGAHGAYPWLGDNALVKLQRSVHNVLARYPVATEEAWRTTVNLARVHTPNQARNQVPAEAEAWLDIRFPPEDTDLAGQSTGQIAAYLQGFCEPGVTAVVDHVDAPQNADRGRPEITRLAGAALAQGYQPEFLRKHGTGDACFYGDAGITAVAFGVGGHGQHGAEEYADIATIEPYYRALTQFLRDPGSAGLRVRQRQDGEGFANTASRQRATDRADQPSTHCHMEPNTLPIGGWGRG
jgi:succinyl-diaminopimelate desuccinylase